MEGRLVGRGSKGYLRGEGSMQRGSVSQVALGALGGAREAQGLALEGAQALRGDEIIHIMHARNIIYIIYIIMCVYI